MAVISFTAVSSSLMLSFAAPTPIETTTIFRRGTAIALASFSSDIRAGTTSLRYCWCNRAAMAGVGILRLLLVELGVAPAAGAHAPAVVLDDDARPRGVTAR